MIDLNNQKDLQSAKRIKQYQEWYKYLEFVETVFNQHISIDKLETEVDLHTAKKLKSIKDTILFNNK